MKDGKSFGEWMKEEKMCSRWMALKFAVYGAFLGAILTMGYVFFTTSSVI